MYSLLFCVHSLNTKPVCSGFKTLCVWLSDEANRFFEKVHVDTFPNINAVWLLQFVSPGTSKIFLSYLQRKDFRETLCLDSPSSIKNHEKQRGRSYQRLWWHFQVYWRMGSIPGKELPQKPTCPKKLPYSSPYLITLGFFLRSYRTVCPKTIDNFSSASTWSPWASSRSTFSWATSSSHPSSQCSPLLTGAQVQSWQLFVDKLAIRDAIRQEKCSFF